MVVERGTKIHRRRGTMQRNSRRTATGRELSAMRKLSVDQLMQIIGDCGLIEAVDDLVQEAGDDEALGDFCRDATRMEVKHFVFINLAGGGAVGATNVVGKNFETGHGVRFGIV